MLNGIDAGDYSGVSGSSSGDVNGDGIDDLIIGASGGGPNGAFTAGESYVVLGRANANVWTSPVGGSSGTSTNWRSVNSPRRGLVTIDPSIGVKVTGPTGAVFLDGLTLGATPGRTTLGLDALSIAKQPLMPAFHPDLLCRAGFGIKGSRGAGREARRSVCAVESR